jgi:hypothetical protein
MNKIVPQFSGKIYPDRTFSIGYVPSKKKGVDDSRHDREYESQFDAYNYASSEYGRTQFDSVRFFRGGYEKSVGLSKVTNHHKKEKKRYGTRGITKYGRKCVRCISHILQDKFGRKQMGFGTATLPPMGKSAYRILAANWGDVVRRFFQSIKRHYNRKGETFCYIGVTEVQTKRYKDTGIPYLHLHWGYNCRSRREGDFIISANLLRQLWRRTIENVLRKHGCSEYLPHEKFKASIDAQVVRKNLGGYLGKYLSKGMDAIGELSEEFPDLIPRQWWFASMQCKEMLKNSIIRMDAKMAESFFYQLEHYLHEGVITFARFVEIEIDGLLKKIGLIGVLSKESYELLRE